jgi:ATP-dependent Lhr-like helicase
VRKSEKSGELVVLSAADPLNLVGILTPEARVAAIYRSRILYQDGLPIAAVEGGQLRVLAKSTLEEPQMRTLLARRSLRHPLRPHLRTPSPRETQRLATARERLKVFRV